MQRLKNLFDSNRQWAARMTKADPGFFPRLSQQQTPEYLWIGCSDSRVPANEIVGLQPGEMFVHRNVANVVTHTDLNCLSVIQYAVEFLRVRHIIVCGHYGCSGVQAAVRNDKLGLIDNWLRRVQEVRQKHGAMLNAMVDESDVMRRVCELNVIEQVFNVSRTTIVEDAWWHGQALTIHGWVYGIEDGLLRDLGMCVSRKEEVAEGYAVAVEALGAPAGREPENSQTAPPAGPGQRPVAKISAQMTGEPPPLPRLV